MSAPWTRSPSFALPGSRPARTTKKTRKPGERSDPDPGRDERDLLRRPGRGLHRGERARLEAPLVGLGALSARPPEPRARGPAPGREARDPRPALARARPRRLVRAGAFPHDLAGAAPAGRD